MEEGPFVHVGAGASAFSNSYFPEARILKCSLIAAISFNKSTEDVH
jgi:hypothetical protein